MTTSLPKMHLCPGRCLEYLGLHEDPILNPLIYPGRVPEESGLLADTCLLPLRDDGSNQLGRWFVESTGWTPVEDVWGGVKQISLDDVLRHFDQPTVSERHAVLAVGSNASPGQLRHKFGTQFRQSIVPMTLAVAHGIVPGVSAHVSKAGYVPVTPVSEPGSASQLFVLWLPDNELQVLDRTEPNYNRILLGGIQFPIDLAGRWTLDSCWA